MTIRKKLDTEESREFWKFAEETSKQVSSWPAWKRGESEVRSSSMLFCSCGACGPHPRHIKCDTTDADDIELIPSWDEYFINICEAVKLKSKDPSSKIGALIVGPENNIISTGYNGFPRGIDEIDKSRWERPVKYSYVEHAERNCIYNAARYGISLKGCTLYVVGFGPPTAPCIECAKAIIQSGIVRVVGRAYKEARPDWIDNLNFSVRLLEEANIEFKEM